jgi:hypothetical protein
MSSAMPQLEEVFKISGIPTHTFVRPLEYGELTVALRTHGRGVVIEGPSGIGKTTAVTRALEDLGLADKVARLSARRAGDLELIRALSGINEFGTVLIDDFHRLPREIKAEIADLAKILADEERQHAKLILIGINKAGESLIRFAHDLNNRLDILSFETNPDDKVTELVTLGERALNIELNVKADVVRASHGSFYIAQMLSHQACLDASILAAQPQRVTTSVSFEAARGKVFERLSRTYLDRTMRFARGPRFRREGRAPYLHLLHLLAQSEEWSLSIDQAIASNPGLAGSMTQITEKGYLEQFIEQNDEFTAVMHYDSSSRVLSVEDPQFIYFLRNISWSRFPKDVGFLKVGIRSKYDVALSFAGADRAIAAALNEELQNLEFEVFYDQNEQHRIMAENIEDYLRPVYQSDAQFVVVLLGPDYPKKIWTKFESEQFKERFKDGAVIPVWFTTAPPGLFDETARLGGYRFDPVGDIAVQVTELCDLLRRKIGEARDSLL